MTAVSIGDEDKGALSITNPNYTRAPVQITVAAASAASSQLAVGHYYLMCDIDCYFLQGASSVTAAVDTTSHRLPADRERYFCVSDTTNNGYIAAIRVGGTNGTMQIARIM